MSRARFSNKNQPGNDFYDEASCRGTDPELFFSSEATDIKAAKDICARCVVRDDCLDYALSNRIDDGIWGGFEERERRRILRRRSITRRNNAV